MNAAAVGESETGWSAFRREMPGMLTAALVGVLAAVLWEKMAWPHADIAPFIAFLFVLVVWQGRRLIRHRPLIGVPLAFGLWMFMSAIYYALARF